MEIFPTEGNNQCRKLKQAKKRGEIQSWDVMGPRDGQESENIIRMMSVEPIASHLLPPSHIKDNLWKSYTQRGTTRGLPKQWQTGDQLRWPALQLGDDHNTVIPSSRYFFAHQSCGSGIVQSLIPSELSPLAH